MTLIIANTTAAQRRATRLAASAMQQGSASQRPHTAPQAAKPPTAAKARPRRPLADPVAQAIQSSPYAWGNLSSLARELVGTSGVTLAQAEGILRAAGAVDRDAIALVGM